MSSETLAVHRVHWAIIQSRCPSKGSGPFDAHGKRSRAAFCPEAVTPCINISPTLRRCEDRSLFSARILHDHLVRVVHRGFDCATSTGLPFAHLFICLAVLQLELNLILHFLREQPGGWDAVRANCGVRCLWCVHSANLEVFRGLIGPVLPKLYTAVLHSTSQPWCMIWISLFPTRRVEIQLQQSTHGINHVCYMQNVI